MKAEIQKIVLDLGGKEINLSPEQAKKLHGLLDEMYGHQSVSYPVYIDRWHDWHWNWPQTQWYGTTIDNSGITSNITYCASNSTAKITL